MGFIRPSVPSWCTSPLIRKETRKDGPSTPMQQFRGSKGGLKKDRTLLLIQQPPRAPLQGVNQLRSTSYMTYTWCAHSWDEWKNMFGTRYGAFKWLVMPNGHQCPSWVQRFMKDSAEMSYILLVVYLDTSWSLRQPQKTFGTVREVSTTYARTVLPGLTR